MLTIQSTKMKTNINQTPLKRYSEIPTYWDARPNQMNYHDLPTEEHILDGWRDIVEPVIGENQRKGLLVYDEINGIATYQVIELTPEEIEAKNKVYVPFSISKLQGNLMLYRMGIEAQVLAVIENSGNAEAKKYFEHAATWERQSSIINSLAPEIGMTQDDLDLFFIEAEKIV